MHNVMYEQELGSCAGEAIGIASIGLASLSTCVRSSVTGSVKSLQIFISSINT